VELRWSSEKKQGDAQRQALQQYRCEVMVRWLGYHGRSGEEWRNSWLALRKLPMKI
jgi:hypothetical protein